MEILPLEWESRTHPLHCGSGVLTITAKMFPDVTTFPKSTCLCSSLLGRSAQTTAYRPTYEYVSRNRDRFRRRSIAHFSVSYYIVLFKKQACCCIASTLTSSMNIRIVEHLSQCYAIIMPIDAEIKCTSIDPCS